jgi:hypothetical protein
MVVAVIAMATLSCNLSLAAVDVEATRGAQTMVALAVQATQAAGGSEPTAAEPTVTQTVEPATPTPTSTDVPPSPTPGIEGCIDRASFVTDVTYPDDTEVAGGAAFTKTWRLRNDGTCTWSSSYALVFSHGDSMGGASALPLAGIVAPGSSVDLSVDLVAPTAPGTYQGYWKLRNNSGVLFGIGSGGDSAFWVRIVVAPTAQPTLFFPPIQLTPLIPLLPNFDLEFQNVHTCGGWAFATFRVANTGPLNLEAAQQHIQDLDTSDTLYGPAYSGVPFMTSAMQCPIGQDTFFAGDVRYIGATIGPTSPSGHTGKVTVKMCTKNDMTGLCHEESVNFIFP